MMTTALSRDLTGPRSPTHCQACGTQHDEPTRAHDRDGQPVLAKLDVWREHDDADRPQAVFVVLCRTCSKKLINPHERLYSLVEPNKPLPGLMPLCLDCTHRDGLDCTNPQSKRNGGDGIKLTFPQPTQAFVDGPGLHGRMTFYPGPVSACDGKAVAS